MKQRWKAVMIGCGGMSGAWLAAVRDHFADRVEIVALVDLRLEAANAKAAEFQLSDAWTGTSLEEALQAKRPDLAFNCTIPEAHAATCATALRAGCHVLVEKPLAPTVEEGRELCRIAAEAGRILAVIQNRRYLTGAVAVRRSLENGDIGAIHSLYADFFLGPRFGGFREEMKHPLLLDMAIHTFDQCRQFLGRNAERITCHEFNPPGSWFAQGASATAFFEMQGGACFSYRGSWCARGSNTAWAAGWRILGEKGTLLWDGEETITVERVTEPWDGKSFVEPVQRLEIPAASLGAAGQGHAGNLGEFLQAVDTGTLPQTVAADNLHSLAMVEGAIESARRGVAVPIL